MTVKSLGVVTLELESGKYFWVREHVEKSQQFDTDKDAITAMKTGKVRWSRIG